MRTFVFTEKSHVSSSTSEVCGKSIFARAFDDSRDITLTRALSLSLCLYLANEHCDRLWLIRRSFVRSQSPTAPGSTTSCKHRADTFRPLYARAAPHSFYLCVVYKFPPLNLWWSYTVRQLFFFSGPGGGGRWNSIYIFFCVRRGGLSVTVRFGERIFGGERIYALRLNLLRDTLF